MFDKKKKFIYDFNINQLKKLGPYFTIEKLGEVDIHPAIETYVNAAVDNLIFQDRQQLIGNSIFDYSGDEIGGYLASVDDILKRRKKFSLKFFAELIEKAIDFNINFIQSPKPELLQLVFEDKQHMPVQDIIQRLKHLYYYEYFNKVITSFVSRKKIIALNRDEFNELLNRVDNLSTESNQKEILENFITAASSFFNIGNAGKNDIPLEAFTLFISGKGLVSYNEALKSSIGDSPQTEYDPTYFIKILNSVVEEKVEYVAEEPAIIKTNSVLDDFEGGDVVEEETEPAPEAGEDFDEQFEDFPEEISNEKNNNVGLEELTGDDQEEVEIPIPQSEKSEPEKKPENTVTSFFGGIPDEDNTSDGDESEEFIVADGINLEDFAEAEENDDEVEIPTDDDSTVEETPLFEEGETTSDEFEDIFADITEDQDEEPEIEEQPVEINETTEEETDEFPDFNFEEEGEIPANNSPDMTDEDTGESEPDEESPANERGFFEREGSVDEDHGASFNASMGIAFNNEDDQIPQPANSSEVIDPAVILDHPNMSKIIIEVFDYDMEEFADTMELIAQSDSKEKALNILDQLFERNGVEKTSKEAQNFIDIILEYFD